ncbi:MAG: Stp1/IreP family PP2C-type Ser/Thr phosphatase [Actinobacteria bacterium]|nr:Stp1/IreP family PP2C-type Ser/Thr phosphatase [Actinomycetota bacterium]
MNYRIGTKTDVGRRREVNEDSFLVHEPLFVVADGMGGHVAGDIASSTAIDTIKEESSSANAQDMNTLARLVLGANSRIWEKAQSDASLRGMGTTCTLLMLDSSRAHFAHVGDSRAYLLREGKLTQVTEDHTLVGRMVKEGRLSADEAERHPQRSIVTRALGVDSVVEVDLMTVDLQEGDRILICSDGLSSMIDSDSIASILEEESDPQVAAERLVDAANEAGGEDNITVVILDIVDAETPGVGATTTSRRVDTAESPGSVPSSTTAPSSSEMTYAGGGAIAAPPEVDPSREEQVHTARDEVLDERPARTWPRKLVVGLVIVVLLGIGAFFGVRYLLSNSWYVGVNDEGFVTVYEGIPEEIAGLDLSEEIEVSEIRADQFPDVVSANLGDGIKKDSLEDARTHITNLEEQIEAEERRDQRNRQRDRTNNNAKD